MLAIATHASDSADDVARGGANAATTSSGSKVLGPAASTTAILAAALTWLLGVLHSGVFASDVSTRVRGSDLVQYAWHPQTVSFWNAAAIVL